MTVAAAAPSNFYSYLKGWSGIAVRSAGRGRLEGSLSTLAIYCLRGYHGQVSRISDARLAELYLTQCPGLLSEANPRWIRVRVKPFRAWLLRNRCRIAMTSDELREEQRRRHYALMDDYARHGPHFHDPAHRAAWERAQCP